MKRNLAMFFGMLVLGGCGGGAASQAPVAPNPQEPGLVVPERAGVYVEATAHYGPLVVHEGEIFAEAQSRPWSAYWFPIKDDILVTPSPRNGQHATLDKFDRFAKAILGQDTTAVNEELRRHYYNPMAENWEGRCGAWAIASVLEPEPVLPKEGVKVAGVSGPGGSDVKFFTRDVKALLIKSYETVDNTAFRRFGQPYFSEPGAQLEDIYPDQFHRVMQAELFERQRAFIMDDSASNEVWNTPVWQALVTIERDASDPHVMHVFSRVKGAQSVKVSPDYSGPSKDTIYQYTYDLIGEPQADGGFLVKYGKWTGESVGDHPDYVLSLPEAGVAVRHASSNEQLPTSVVDELLRKTGARP